MITGKTTTPYGSEAGEQIFGIIKDCYIEQQYNAGYLRLVEEINSKKFQDIKDEMEGYIRTSNPDDHYDIYQSFQQDLEQYKNHNPRFLYESLYTGIYSQFEDALREICKAFYHDYEGKIIPNYTTQIIEKYYQIIKHFGDLSSLSPLWKKIRNFQKHRNHITHKNQRRVPTTKEMVEEVNILFCDFIYGISKHIMIPETPPDRSILPPPDKKRIKKHSSK